MEGGIVCDCTLMMLEELGTAASHFNNFKCQNCGKFVHLHGTSDELVDNATLCIDCDYQSWKCQVEKIYR